MPDAVYRMVSLLCPLVAACPLGTNPALLHLLWMLVGGRLLAARGAVFADVGGTSDAAMADAPAAITVEGAEGWPRGAGRRSTEP